MTLTIRVFFCISACLIFANQSLMAHDPHDPIAYTAISPNYAQDHTVFAATGVLSLKVGLYMVLRSTDGGVNWTVVPGLPNNNPMSTIAISPGYSQDQTLYIAGGGGLFESTNQGASWTAPLTQSLVNVALSPNFANDNTLFVVTSLNTVRQSTNRGQSWKTLAVPGPLTSGLNVLAVSPNYAVDKTLLLGSIADGIFESTNGGSSWVQVTAGLTLPRVTTLAFSPNFSSDQTAFAGTLGSGFLLSTNGGASWRTANSGLSDLNVTSLALSPNFSQDTTFWATTAVAGVFQSSSLGASWTLAGTVSRKLSNLTNVHYQTVAAASSGSSTVLYLAMYEGEWTSPSTPLSWRYIDTLPTRLLRHINISPNYANDQTIFANSYGGANLWSTNGGTTWTFKNTGMQLSYTDASGISSNFAADGTAFCGNSNGLQRTSNRGASWQLMTGIGAADYPRALAVSPNFALDQTVLIGATTNGRPTDEGLFLSTNAGSTWVATSLNGISINAIGISPAFATDRTAFAASASSGFFKSTDGGMTWTKLTLPASSQLSTTVAVSPAFATDGTVFAGGQTGGIFKSMDGGSTWAVVPQTTSLRALDIQLSPNYAVDRTMFVGTFQSGLMVSNQGGQGLAQVTSYPDNLVLAVAFSPNFTSDQTVFAASYHGLYKSTDGGATWSYTAEPGRIEDTRSVAGTNPVQQPPSIVYGGTWTSVTAPKYASTNSYMITGAAQATASLNFTGSGVRWVSRIGPTQGTATVQLDGVLQTTVSLNAPTDEYQQFVWVLRGIACGTHTLTLTNTSPPGQTISVDAFDVWVDTCPVTN